MKRVTREFVSRRVRRFERRVFPKLRHKKSYRTITGIILMPLALATYAIDSTLIYLNTRKPRKKAKSINLKNIIDGFSNLAFPNEEVEAIAMTRADICAACPSATKMGVYSVIADNRTKVIQGMKCSECGCNLSAKVRSVNDTCPLGKW